MVSSIILIGVFSSMIPAISTNLMESKITTKAQIVTFCKKYLARNAIGFEDIKINELKDETRNLYNSRPTSLISKGLTNCFENITDLSTLDSIPSSFFNFIRSSEESHTEEASSVFSEYNIEGSVKQILEKQLPEKIQEFLQESKFRCEKSTNEFICKFK